jgi:hypothetical protein
MNKLKRLNLLRINIFAPLIFQHIAILNKYAQQRDAKFSCKYMKCMPQFRDNVNIYHQTWIVRNLLLIMLHVCDMCLDNFILPFFYTFSMEKGTKERKIENLNFFTISSFFLLLLSEPKCEYVC